MSRLFRAALCAILFAASFAMAGSGFKAPLAQNETGGPRPWTAIPKPPAAGEPLHFVVIPDRTGAERPGFFPQVVQLAAKQKPQFVICIGDLIQGYTTDTVAINREWDEFDSLIKPLGAPFFYVQGNHDNTYPEQRAVWGQRRGPAYYSFTYDGALFIVLNAFDGVRNKVDWQKPAISPRQVQFVRETLLGNPHPRWTFLFLHAPIWLEPDSSAAFQEIDEALAGQPHTFFGGHIHRYDYMKKDRGQYITLATAGGGSKTRGVAYGEFDHCLDVTLSTGRKPEYCNLLLDGRKYGVDVPVNPELARGEH